MRTYVILNANDAHLIDFSKVCQVSIDAVTFSNNFEKILLSYEGQSVPSFIKGCKSPRSYDRLGARNLMAGSGWSIEEEEIL